MIILPLEVDPSDCSDNSKRNMSRDALFAQGDRGALCEAVCATMVVHNQVLNVDSEEK